MAAFGEKEKNGCEDCYNYKGCATDLAHFESEYYKQQKEIERLREESDKLKADLQYSEMDLRNQVSQNVQLKRENEQLRETVTNQEIVISCYKDVCQSLDIGIGD